MRYVQDEKRSTENYCMYYEHFIHDDDEGRIRTVGKMSAENYCMYYGAVLWRMVAKER